MYTLEYAMIGWDATAKSVDLNYLLVCTTLRFEEALFLELQGRKLSVCYNIE